MTSIAGIGNFTSHVVAMRALRYVDAFPSSDLGVRKALNSKIPASSTAALKPGDRGAPTQSFTSGEMLMQTVAEKLKTRTISSPVGDIVVYATDAALVAVFIDAQKHQIAYDAETVRGAHAILDSAERDLRAYFKGDREVRTPLKMNGTPFQMKVWRALTTIPFGETWSYGQLAKKIGSPDAVRAVGTANSRK